MIPKIRQTWQTSGPYLLAAGIFGASRLVVVMAILFARQFVPRKAGQEYWSAGDAWYYELLRWDAGWYFHILQNGYNYSATNPLQQPVAFYPLYPLVSRLLSSVFHVEGYISLLIVSNVAACLAVLLFFKLVREQFDDDIALLAVAFLSFFPTSVFFSAGYTESLSLLLILSFFLLIKRRHFVLAALAAGLATASRSSGLVLLPVLLWELWQRFAGDRRRLLAYAIPCTVLAVSGLSIYVLYMWSAFGNPLAFVSAQGAWNGDTSLGERLVTALTLRPLRHPSTGGWYFIGFLLLAAASWWRLPSSWVLFAVGILLLPYLTLSGGPAQFAAMPRFVILAFPVFVFAGVLCKGRIWPAVCGVGLSAALLFKNTALFASWHWIG